MKVKNNIYLGMLIFLLFSSFAHAEECNFSYIDADIELNITNESIISQNTFNRYKDDSVTFSVINKNPYNITMNISLIPLNISYTVGASEFTVQKCEQRTTVIYFNEVGRGYMLINISNVTNQMVFFKITLDLGELVNKTLDSGECTELTIFQDNTYSNYTICASKETINYTQIDLLKEALESLKMDNATCDNETFSTYFIEARPELQGLLDELKDIQDIDCEGARNEVADAWLNVNKGCTINRDTCYSTRDGYKSSLDVCMLTTNSSTIVLAGKLYDCEETKNLRIQDEIKKIRNEEVLPRNIALVLIGLGLIILAIYKWKKKQNL